MSLEAKPKFGILGLGRYGQSINKKLDALGRIIWTGNSETDYQHFEVPDWVFIATPNQYHYEQAAYFIEAGANVFLEKPATLGAEGLVKLISLAAEHNIKFYVSDVFRFHKDLANLGGLCEENCRFVWKKESRPDSGSLLDRLAYHHLYLIHDTLRNPVSLEVREIKNNAPDDLQYSLEIDGNLLFFEYSCAIKEPGTDEHVIFGRDFIPADNDALSEMLAAVIGEKVSFDGNHRRAIWTSSAIAQLKRVLHPTVGVVGGGIFGCVSAIEIAALGYNVTLYERHSDLIGEASFINQYRVHRGYHYPRSPETARECKSSADGFVKAFRQAVTSHSDGIIHQYGISRLHSKVTADQYLEFLETMGLPYRMVDSLPGTDLTIEVDECLFNPIEMRKVLKQRLLGVGVQVELGTEASEACMGAFDYKVFATYANLNDWATKARDYQFELCEKPVLKLDNKYAKRSVVILDGPFMCIDPLPSTDFHVMGHVQHAIHHSNIGSRPEVPSEYSELLNQEIIKNPRYTHIDRFLSSAEAFFPGISRAEHVGSMYTIRTVLPDRDHDDARPTLIEQTRSKSFQLFSGKICTSVRAAKDLAMLIERDFSTFCNLD